MSSAESKRLEEELYSEKLRNRLLEAENNELKLLISEYKSFPNKEKKIKNTFIYKCLRKIKHFIIRGNHE